MNLGRVLAVMHRDLLRIRRNPFALGSSVLLPLAYLLILGNALQGPVTKLRLAIVALDNGPQARELMGALQAIERGPKTVILQSMQDPQDALAELRAGKISGVLIIPPDFSRDRARGLAASVGLYVDNVDQVAEGALVAAVQAAVPASTAPPVRFEQHLGAAQARVQEAYPRVDYDTSLIPGVVVMSIFMGSLVAGAFNVVMDRFLGVHESYLSTPLKKSDINLGVLSAGTVVTMTSSAVVLTVSLLITRARVHGGVLGYLALAGVVLLTALGLLAMMMIVLGRAHHPRIVGLVSGFLSVILFFPSGALYPIASFPGWLRAFAHVNPETHAVAALKAILFRGGDLSAAGAHALWLAGFAAVMLMVSTATLKRTL